MRSLSARSCRADAIELIPTSTRLSKELGCTRVTGCTGSPSTRTRSASRRFRSASPTAREIAYAKLAAKSAHYVVSTTLEAVSWPRTARIIPNVGELRALKDQPGKNIYVVGGPTLVTSLLNENLLDELKLIVHPLLLGGGKALFAGVSQRRSLQLAHAEPTKSGKVVLTYRL
jgi:dihydrofolate reductase